MRAGNAVEIAPPRAGRSHTAEMRASAGSRLAELAEIARMMALPK
jgi:hypothetical protein